MEITKRENAYVLQQDGITITTLNTGRGWAVIGDTPPALMGKFISVDAVKKAFEGYLGIIRDKKALAENPLTDVEIPLEGTILDPDLKYGPPPTRKLPPLPKRHDDIPF